MDVQLIDPAIHGQGPGVACFAISFADPDDARRALDFDFEAQVTNGTLLNVTLDAETQAATNGWFDPLGTSVNGNDAHVSGAKFFGFSGTNLAPNNNPIIEICIYHGEDEDPCMALSGSMLTIGSEFAFMPCTFNFPGGDVICASDFAPNVCDQIGIDIVYTGWLSGHHCFEVRFTDPSVLTNVIGLSLQFDFSVRGGNGEFITPGFADEVRDLTREWESPAISFSSDANGQGVIANFNAFRGNSGSPADFSDVGNYFLKLLVTEADPNVDYCVSGMTGSIQFVTPQGIVFCDLNQLIQNAEACSDDNEVAIDIDAVIFGGYDCNVSGTGPGVGNVNVDITYSLPNGAGLTSCFSQSAPLTGQYGCSFLAENGGIVRIEPREDASLYLDGITVNDVGLIQRHVLGLPPLQQNWRDIIAMDVDMNFFIQERDADLLRQLILFNTPPAALTAPVWKFVPETDFNQISTRAPSRTIWPIYDPFIEFNAGDPYNPNFQAVKTGDVDGDVESCTNLRLASSAREGHLVLRESQTESDNYEYVIYMPSATYAGVLDIAFFYDGSVPHDLEVEVSDTDLHPDHAYHIDEDEGRIRFVVVQDTMNALLPWDSDDAVLKVSSADREFINSLRLGSAITYNALTGEATVRTLQKDDTYSELSLNHQLPNLLHIDYTGQPEKQTLQVFNSVGQVVWQEDLWLEAGEMTVDLPNHLVSALYIARLRAGDSVATSTFFMP